MDTKRTQGNFKTGEIGINKEKKTALDGTVLLVRTLNRTSFCGFSSFF